MKNNNYNENDDDEYRVTVGGICVTKTKHRNQKKKTKKTIIIIMMIIIIIIKTRFRSGSWRLDQHRVEFDCCLEAVGYKNWIAYLSTTSSEEGCLLECRS